MTLFRIFFCFLFSFACTEASAQSLLSHSINSPVLPIDSAIIDSVATYIDSTSEFVSSGFQVGDTVPDFTLFDTGYVAVTLSNVLDDGKPVMLIASSYSCPVSRRGMTQVLPDLVAQFGAQVNFIVVYTEEAHPVTPDWSPYYNGVFTTTENYHDSVLIHQEEYFVQRKQEARLFSSIYNPQTPVLIDGCANEYWRNFGPAPNNAYLLLPSGVVLKKYGWFANEKPQIITDIDSLVIPMGASGIPGTAFTVFPVPAFSQEKIQTDFPGEWSL
ncbi:MAG TPA: hypothetical protein VL651_07180, partial [Bacteroidia bacterium]|nr:hypothetical protein [Bacteroidia bacterium]